MSRDATYACSNISLTVSEVTAAGGAAAEEGRGVNSARATRANTARAVNARVMEGMRARLRLRKPISILRPHSIKDAAERVCIVGDVLHAAGAGADSRRCPLPAKDLTARTGGGTQDRERVPAGLFICV